MLSKEEIEESKECLKEIIQNTYAEGKAKKLDNLMNYIEQLETAKQKLINFLESKNIDTIEKEGQEPYEHMSFKKATIEIDEILKIVKGEKE